MSDTNTYLGTDSEPQYAPTGDEKTMAMLSHLITFVSSFLGPLIIYLVKKDESKFVAEHAKESLNFQITLFIAGVIMFISIIGILFLWALGILGVVLAIVAGIKANEGKAYRYPISLRLIK